MKKSVIPVLITLLLAIGCGRHGGDVEHAEHTEHAEHALKVAGGSKEAAPPLHKESEGILLCDATKDSIALKTGEVSERKEGGTAILVVPKSAILDTTAGTSVFVENGAHYKRTTVKAGRTFGDLVEITEGVYEGDKVVTSGAQVLWLIELRAVKGGKGCCPMPDAKGKSEGKPEKAGHAH